MKRLIQTILWWLLVLLVLAALAGAGWAAVTLFHYEQLDDETHLAAKREYLKALPDLTSRRPPNIVLILFDDLGYGDLGSFGSEAIATPHIDRLAQQGARLTSYYSPAPNCTPSRAAMLTGRYAPRTGLTMIVFPNRSPLTVAVKLGGQNIRLPAEEITIADVLGASGYATGMAGKWHLGNHSPSLPNDMGFDEYLGVLYSNDMEPLALYKNGEEVAPDPVDQGALTHHYTSFGVDFIQRNRAKPFFLYVAHSFPHIPLHPSPEQAGRSKGGRYGDVVEDLDHSVGEIVAAIDRLGLGDDTLIFVTSDNGPWYQGSAGRVRGRKNHIFEGGMRVPAIARWSGKVEAASEIDEMMMGIDLLPTVFDLLNVPPPPDRYIDGKSALGLLVGGEKSGHEELFYFAAADLMAVRTRRYKYRQPFHVPIGAPYGVYSFAWPKGPWLFDLSRDPDESYDISELEPEVMAAMEERMTRKLLEMDRNPRGWVGK